MSEASLRFSHNKTYKHEDNANTTISLTLAYTVF